MQEKERADQQALYCILFGGMEEGSWQGAPSAERREVMRWDGTEAGHAQMSRLQCDVSKFN